MELLPVSPVNKLPHYNARKTHCKRGHAYDTDNTYRKSDGGRNCNKCRVISRNNWIIKKAEELKSHESHNSTMRPLQQTR